MICYHRKIAWLDPERGLVFRFPLPRARAVSVPCGKCLACRANAAQSWALRVMHEAQYVDTACFVTLTYDPAHCPKDYSLVKKDVQDFMKRLRRHLEYHSLGSVRAFMAVGEYGAKRQRPHYHVLLLGWSPDDLVFYQRSYSGEPIYTSEFLESVWQKGFCPVGTVKESAAAYVARYGRKLFEVRQVKRDQPFLLSSRNIPLDDGSGNCDKVGALGAQWVLDNHQALRLGYVSVRLRNGSSVKRRIPEYYFTLMEKWFPEEYDALKQYRLDYAMAAKDGLLLCDGIDHKPSYFVTHECSDEIAALRLQFDIGSDIILPDSVRRLAREYLLKQESAQVAALEKLKRNVE